MVEMKSITIFTKADVPCCRNQTYRFLGVNSQANDELDALYEECLALIKEKACFRSVYRKTAVEHIGNNKIKFDFCTIESASLCKNLEGCEYAFVFAATIGAEVDRLLLKLSAISRGKAAMADCVASSLIECWCDAVNEEITRSKKAKPRFSPGYGGVDLSCQRAVFDFLGVEKNIGVSLTDSFFMTPKKSVTAIIGITEV